MKHYKITINGTTYEVDVEECGGGAQVKKVQAIKPPVARTTSAPAPTAAAPAPSSKRTAPKASSAASAGTGDVAAPMAGTVLSVAVSEGQQVNKGQLLLIFEAMKMENELVAPCNGTVKKVYISKGAAMETGMVLITIE